MDGSTGSGAAPINPDSTEDISESISANLGATNQTAQSSPAGASNNAAATSSATDSAQPREVGTFKQELIDRPLADIKEGLSEFFSLSKLLNIQNPYDTPEQKTKRQQMLQKFNQMTQAEQAVAQQHYQEQMQRRQQQEEEAAYRSQQEEARRAQSIATPSGPQNGSPDQHKKSSTQMAMQKLKDDRTTIGKLQSAG